MKLTLFVASRSIKQMEKLRKALQLSTLTGTVVFAVCITMTIVTALRKGHRVVFFDKKGRAVYEMPGDIVKK